MKSNIRISGSKELDLWGALKFNFASLLFHIRNYTRCAESYANRTLRQCRPRRGV